MGEEGPDDLALQALLPVPGERMDLGDEGEAK